MIDQSNSTERTAPLFAESRNATNRDDGRGQPEADDDTRCDRASPRPRPARSGRSPLAASRSARRDARERARARRTERRASASAERDLDDARDRESRRRRRATTGRTSRASQREAAMTIDATRSARSTPRAGCRETAPPGARMRRAVRPRSVPLVPRLGRSVLDGRARRLREPDRGKGAGVGGQVALGELRPAGRSPRAASSPR